MRYLALLILIALTFISCTNQAPEKKEKNKKLKKEGLVKVYYQDGSLAKEINYESKKKNGLTRNYYKNGKLLSEIHYVNDVRHGNAKTYYENGNVKNEVPYKNGQIDGIVKKYRENGMLMAEIPYKEDLPGAGLVEYTKEGKKKKYLPKLKVEKIDNILREGQYIVRAYFEDRGKKITNTRFYMGALVDNKYLDEKGMMKMVAQKGVLELKFEVAPGTFIMEKISLVASSKTLQGNYQIEEQVVNIAAENRGY